MKKILLLIIPVIAILGFSNCKNDQKANQQPITQTNYENPTPSQVLEAMDFETKENKTLEGGFKSFDIQGPLGYGSAVCGDIDEGTHIIIYDEGRDFELMNRICEKYETLVMPVISRDTEERYDFKIETDTKTEAKKIRITVKKRRPIKTI
jgi:hypothetical protein